MLYYFRTGITLLCLIYSTMTFAADDLVTQLPQISCSAMSEYHIKTSNEELNSLESLAENSPLYYLATNTAKKNPTCKFINDDTGLTLFYKFNRSAEFRITSNSAIKLNGQVLTLSSHHNLNEEQVIASLQSLEKKTFGEKGCGIKWKKPQTHINDENNTLQKIWRGDTCSCKGDIVFKNKFVTKIFFQTTC